LSKRKGALFFLILSTDEFKNKITKLKSILQALDMTTLLRTLAILFILKFNRKKGK